jgi:hypothetical protein
MCTRSGLLQRQIDDYAKFQKLGMPPPSSVLSLGPLQTLAYADNHQMTMFRDSLFMNKLATVLDEQVGDDFGAATWYQSFT